MTSLPSLRYSGGSKPSTQSKPRPSTLIADFLSSRNRARLFLMCGVLLVAAVAISTGLILSNLRERALSDSESALQNIALVLAEQTDRTFQTTERIQMGLLERMKTLGVASSAEFDRQMSDHDAHLMLKAEIAHLPYIDDIMIVNANGNLINSSRSRWISKVNVSDQDYFTALQSDPLVRSFVGAPVRNPDNGTWSIYLARKFSNPDGEFLGLVLGAIELRYFEDFFAAVLPGEESAISLFRRDG